MDKIKIATIAKKAEGLAIGFIGVCFFSMGTTYFQERFVYRMPRILAPVYDYGACLCNAFVGIGTYRVGIHLEIGRREKGALFDSCSRDACCGCFSCKLHEHFRRFRFQIVGRDYAKNGRKPPKAN